jgi:DNA primase
MRQLPGQYVLSKFYTYAGEPAFRKFDGIYNASCNICREGKSWLKKKRLFFYPSTNSFYCFNCSRSWNAMTWIQASTGLSRQEIELEAFEGNNSIDISKQIKNTINQVKIKTNLPHDSINIIEKNQQNHYKSNVYVLKALEYLKSRRLNSAINACDSYYISLTDYFHKNRLCIPYLDNRGKITFYQTRALDESEPRYLNKIGEDKTCFGLNKVNSNLDYIFLFEGPIDAMFMKNGVSLAGLTMTKSQEKQLSEFPFHERIWVLDNPHKDPAAKDKILKLLEAKEKVFRWPLNNPYKDFNEWAVAEGVDEIPQDIILKSLFF